MLNNPPESLSLLRKFVSTARSIITNQVGLPLGILRLQRNLYWLKQQDIKPLTDEELEVVEAYYSQIIDFPLTEERRYWQLSALQKLDREIEELTALYGPQLLTILSRVVAEQT